MKAKIIKVQKFSRPFKAGPLDHLTLQLDKVEVDKTTGKSRVIRTEVIHKQGFTHSQTISCYAAIEINGNIGYVVGDDTFFDECQAEMATENLMEELKLSESLK